MASFLFVSCIPVNSDPYFTSVTCCDDECSGLASWSIVLYDGDPFDECCDPDICEETMKNMDRVIRINKRGMKIPLFNWIIFKFVK